MNAPVPYDYPSAIKLPPHAIEAERAVIGSLVITVNSFDQIDGLITENDFYHNGNRLYFRAIESLAGQGRPHDAVTVSEWLEDSGDLSETGGLPELVDIASHTPNNSNLIAYAELVRDRSVRRHLITSCNEITDSAYKPGGQATAELLDIAETQILAIGDQTNKQKKGPVKISAVVNLEVEAIGERAESGLPPGLMTGYKDIDKMTQGMHPGDLIVVAGRPAMGKTAWSMNIVEHVTVRLQKHALAFSMEMPSMQLAQRMISGIGRVPLANIREGNLTDSEWSRIISAQKTINDATLHVDDTGGLTVDEIRSRARRIDRDVKGISLIMIDYLQLMKGPKAENKNHEISEITRSLKSLAKELNVPIILLSQLNRSLETRPDKRPIMADLRDSGAIEQDADLIAFVYRDEVYFEDSDWKGTAEIIIAKQRSGPTGKVRLTFEGEFTRFSDYAADDRFPSPPEQRYY